MGGNAYDYLQQTATHANQQAQATVFGELAEQFSHCVDLIAIVTGKCPTGAPGCANAAAEDLALARAD